MTSIVKTYLAINEESIYGFKLAIHGTGYPLPGGYDELKHNLTK